MQIWKRIAENDNQNNYVLMKYLTQLKKVNWLRMLLFYIAILIGTYFARKLPNVLNLALQQITDISFSFNYNHGLITLVVALAFYKVSKVRQQITLFGDKKWRSILFASVLFICYTTYGISNAHGINRHIWALVFCTLALVYNLMEEYAWRGYLIENLGKLNFVLKSILSGLFWAAWHLLVFNNFEQYGGFFFFLIFCILFSFLLTFSVLRTKSVLVAASFHAFIIQTNVAALICFIIFILLLLTWNKKISFK